MTFVIITHVPHILEQDQYFGYAPYVHEMNIWGRYVDEFIIVAPTIQTATTAIDIPYGQGKIKFIEIEAISLLGFKAIFNAVFKAPKIGWNLFKAIQKADHIHLRCPGNIGLLGCIVQILFPYKQKSAKYAGNWDPKSKQPWTYRLQKWILNNTFLTKNIKVLVYGEWEGSSKNIKSFFTATYAEADKVPLREKSLIGPIGFVFVGTLVSGKRPLYAIQLVEALYKNGLDVLLTLYGEGTERNYLEEYIHQNNLENRIVLQGNQPQNVIQKGYEESHFVILPSQSEGWPKAIAEGMFWGCVPIATVVSCVPFMLDQGNRGVLLTMNLEKDLLRIEDLIKNETGFKEMSTKASHWSRQYTMDFFEGEVKKILK